MRSFTFFGLLLLTLSAVNCSKGPVKDADLIWIEVPLYQCCNVWGDPTSNDEIIPKVRSFFRAEGMFTNQVELIHVGPTVLCTHCCQCTSDHIIRVQLPSFFEDRAVSFGFTPD